MCPGQLHLNSFANLSLSLFSSILVCLQHRGEHVCLQGVSMSIYNKAKNKNKNKKKKKKKKKIKIKNKNKKTKKVKHVVAVLLCPSICCDFCYFCDFTDLF